MKTLIEKQALANLHKVKTAFQTRIRDEYESNAKDCLTCETKGACCLDVHFVNVHITRLEAVAIHGVLKDLSEEKRKEIYKRTKETVNKYDLSAEGDTFSKKFACPLFEKEIGCLAHEKGKPAPCIQHACYEKREDMPPDKLLTETEHKIARLNARSYGNAWNLLPLPIWLEKLNSAETGAN